MYWYIIGIDISYLKRNGGANMDYREIYESWLNNPYFDEDTKEELRAIADEIGRASCRERV